VIFAAYYMLPMVQSVFFNKLETEENRHIEDLSPREMAILAPLCALMILIGWNPTPVLERMEPSVRAVIERVETMGPEAGRLQPSSGLAARPDGDSSGAEDVLAEDTDDDVAAEGSIVTADQDERTVADGAE
jgi:hypothetical protein